MTEIVQFNKNNNNYRWENFVEKKVLEKENSKKKEDETSKNKEDMDIKKKEDDDSLIINVYLCVYEKKN